MMFGLMLGFSARSRDFFNRIIKEKQADCNLCNCWMRSCAAVAIEMDREMDTDSETEAEKEKHIVDSLELFKRV